MFPQMMRFALPGIGNNWQVLVNDGARVDHRPRRRREGVAGRRQGTLRFFFFTLIAGAVYLAITTSNFVLMWLEKRYSTGVRKADL
jgi:histidine transport system permease protein